MDDSMNPTFLCDLFLLRISFLHYCTFIFIPFTMQFDDETPRQDILIAFLAELTLECYGWV